MKNGFIHWHEGQFLQPHLFQAAQRAQVASFADARRTVFSFPYGLIDAAISHDALEAKRVRFTKLRAVMPVSGMVVELGSNMELPDLDISEAFQSSPDPFTIRLGVPLYQESSSNTIPAGSVEDRRVAKLFREVQVERRDDNAGDNAQTIAMRVVNARLLFEREDTTNLEWLAVLRVAHQTGARAQFPTEDRGFYPTSLVVNASESLRSKVQELATDVLKHREETARQAGAGFNVDLLKPRTQVQLLRLSALNRSAPRLAYSTAGLGISTLDLYLLLRELHGELAALTPDRDAFPFAPKYDHDRPGLWYDDLDRNIRKLLIAEGPSKYRAVYATLKDGTWHGTLGEKDSYEPKAYYLGIKSPMDIDSLRKIAEDQKAFKLMPLSQAGEDIWGVRMTYEQSPPPELPQEVDLRYFRVSMQDTPDNLEPLRMWKRVLQEKKFVVKYPFGVRVELGKVDPPAGPIGVYMVLP